MTFPTDWALGDLALGVGLLLFGGAMLRGQAIYWLARVVTDRVLAGGAEELRGVRRWLHGDGVTRARAALARHGWPLVPVAYLTVGFQSMVMAAAGMVRMNAVVFTLAQVPGAIAWAVLYSTVGFAFWGAAFAAARGNPWWLALLLGGLVVAVVARRRLRRGGRRPGLSRPR